MFGLIGRADAGGALAVLLCWSLLATSTPQALQFYKDGDPLDGEADLDYHGRNASSMQNLAQFIMSAADRNTNQRNSDQRGPDQRGPDQRGPEQRGPEQRGPDQRGPEQRDPDTRNPDTRVAARISDTRLMVTDTRNKRALALHPDHRLRHSRHLEGYSPIRPLAAASPAKLAVKDNHKPIFKECSSYRPTVPEEAPIGTPVNTRLLHKEGDVFTVHASDPDPLDSGGRVTYKFVSTAGEKERFHVDPHTGKVTTADVFDHDEPSREKEVYITVRASDNGQPQLDDACTIKITIVDINDNAPVFDKVSYTESVPQDLQLGREVMRISATDIDDGNNSIVHYSLDSNSPDQAYFHIDPDTGVIFLNKTIDKHPGYKFRLSGIVKDMGEPPQLSSIALDIQVIESNKKSPSFLEVPDGPIVLQENYTAFGDAIARIKASSNIPGEEKVQFELVQGQTEQTNKWHTFILEPESDSALIKLGNHLDYEKITEYTLTVRIQNNYRLAAETIISILITDVNDNIPVFSEIRSGSVLENEAVGTMVMQVQAFDYDATAPNNVVRYELGDPGEPFAIDPVTGNITTLAMFDREQKAVYNIKVIAYDNAESSLTKGGQPNAGVQYFLIDIADKNDNPPHFTQDTYVAESIAENANINELVTQVTAVDIDTASVVTYSIVAGNTYDAFTIRNITGEIRVNRELDYENITSYSLDVRAFDGIYEDYCKVIINIENLNDNPPVFLANYTKTIEEEKLYPGCIVKVEAYDPDIKDRSVPQNIVYSLVKHEQREFLDIDNDGCLRLTKPLDRDQPSGFARWQILIMAADHGGRLGSDSLRSTTEVILELTDINDNAPFLTNTQPIVWYENEPPSMVVTLTAKDYDSPENGPPFTFELNDTTSFSVRSKFSIQGNVLYTLSAFDREQIKEYMIPILITDSGTPRMTGLSMLHIIVGDKNDNPMAPGHSNIFVYNYRGESPDMEIGRVYVEDPDDWDVVDKKFAWLPSYEMRSPFFDVNTDTGMIIMKTGTPNGNYVLKFNVTEENEPRVPFHWVQAVVNVTVKEIPEEAVDKSGSIRFINITAEAFIKPEPDGTSKKEKLHRRLAKLYNVTMDNVDVFTVYAKPTVKDQFLDVRFSCHGSPYYSPEKLNSMLTGIMDKLEDELQTRIYMVHIDECLIEREQCEDSCRNVLIKNNVPLAVYTNTTSFIGVSARVESECTCEGTREEDLICLNGGTPVADKCECLPGYLGPLCEQTSVGFHGDGWAMYPAPPSCHEGRITFTVVAHNPNALIFFMGPLTKNGVLVIKDFMAVELKEGFPVLLVNYGSGTTRLNNSVVRVADGKPHLIEIIVMRTSIEMFVDQCKLTTCMSLAAPTGTNQILNIHGPLFLGGTNFDMKALAEDFGWSSYPTTEPLAGCITNFTYNDYWYNLGSPSMSKNVESTCQRSMFTAVTFGIDTNFLVAILVCVAILVILLLAVVVHRRRADAWHEKELDDIRENIIAYEDEGGGEGDAGYDLHVLRQMYDGPPPDNEGFMHASDYIAETSFIIEDEPGPSGLGLKPNEERPYIRSWQVGTLGYQLELPTQEQIMKRINDLDEDIRENGAKVVVCDFPSSKHTSPLRHYLLSVLVEGLYRRPTPGRELPEDLLMIMPPIPGPPPSPEHTNPVSGTARVSAPGLLQSLPINPEPVDPQPSTSRGVVYHLPGSYDPGVVEVVEGIPVYRDPTGLHPDSPPVICGPPRTSKSGLLGAAPDISGFLDGKKDVMDREQPEINPYDDVRHYAYEGDGNTSGSLSSLASCTDDGDLKFNYLSTFGPRFRKLADMYGDSDDDRAPHEESWC